MSPIPLLTPVALVSDLPEHRLTHGQMGTVVEYLQAGDEEALLVEFSDNDGRTQAMVPLKPDQLA